MLRLLRQLLPQRPLQHKNVLVIIQQLMGVVIPVQQIKLHLIQVQHLNGLVKNPITLTLTLVRVIVQMVNTQLKQLVKLHIV